MRRLPLACLLVISGCFGAAAPTVAPNVTHQQQATAARAMGLTFPPGTKFFFYLRESGGPDDAIFLKVELPAAAMPGFLASPTFTGSEWSQDSRSVSDVADWSAWRPSKAVKFRSGQVSLPNAEYLNVLIDDDRQDAEVIYLQWFQT